MAAEMVFGSGKKLTFRDYVQGTWGSFTTPAGKVDYIMTKARLGEDSEDPERQLTKSLAPVREVMEVSDMDFNQLLQRDLDDHRVAVKLIPYLLKAQQTGPAFFPPIVAVLLPFRNRRPSSFPKLGEPIVVEDDEARWLQERAGDSFQVQRLLRSDNQLHPASVGKLWWNSTQARLVVLDGQHRAMALIAIERTMTNGWQSSSGARFRSFYEHQVKQVLLEAKQEGIDLNKVEIPVTVCWFPELTGEDAKPHDAARKLFVDVNNEARQPSQSRIILLSDAELSNVLTRRLLNELRGETDGSYIPLYAVEYDNPDANSTRPARWSVMTNIHLLKSAVDTCIFGPRDYLKDVTKKSKGRTKPGDRDRFMREQLNIPDLFPSEFEDGGFTYHPDRIGNTEFPLGKVDRISDRFAETWGRAILTLLSKTAPYAAHSRALRKLNESWHIDDTAMTLAHDALFNGVGVFWTLKDSYDHYEERKSRGHSVTKSDVIRAWEALDRRESEFEAYRAQEYLDNDKSIKQSNSAYSVFNTHACQLGLVMTLGSLWELRKSQLGWVNIYDLPAFAEDMTKGINAYFDQKHGRARDRRLAFIKDVSVITNPLNRIDSMETSQAVHFRYFWMQVLDTPMAWQHVSPWIKNQQDFKLLLSAARENYLKLRENQMIRALKNDPNIPEKELQKEARKKASLLLKRALRDWFYLPEEYYDEWFRSIGTSQNALDASPSTSNAP
ncbi:DNA sulfur modification protein DndB [Thermomonospora curvata]|nr:DNA sulfur modification protein DndB [Thermomonospora curvata]